MNDQPHRLAVEGFNAHLRAPELDLAVSTGGRAWPRDLMGPQGLLLVFYRGHWCPYCRRYLGKLAANATRFAQRGVKIAAVSPEPPITSNQLRAKLQLPFPLLCDTQGIAIDAYGVRAGRRGTATPRGSASLLPHPAVFLIDAEFVIRFHRIDRNFKRRTTMHTLFGAVGSLQSATVLKAQLAAG